MLDMQRYYSRSREVALRVVYTMCNIITNGICRFSELAPNHFGITKQLVLHVALPHITLLVVSMGYAILGCWIMTVINYSDKDSIAEAVQLLLKERKLLTEELLDRFIVERRKNRLPSAVDTVPSVDHSALFMRYAQRLYDVHDRYPPASAILMQQLQSQEKPKPPAFSVSWNLFFTVTCLTSIGYGVNTPNSLIGRLFCILFITFGIPLYLITIADLAKFCTECMNSLWTECIKIRYQMGQWIQRRWRCRNRYTRTAESENCDADEDDSMLNIEQVIIAGGEEEVAEFLWTHLEKARFVDVPFILVYTILIGYIFIASYLISHMEGWTLQDGLYFVVMSVLTIGFGDIMPTNDKFVLVTMAVIIVGLIVTTTCVDIVGAYYIDQLHFFGRRLDIEDPLEWLRLVRQKRIEAMKREAMRKLFETVTALHHMYLPTMNKLEKILSIATAAPSDIKLPEPPRSPRGIVAFHATAQSMCLRWDPPLEQPTGCKQFWYTLSYKTRTPQRRDFYTVVDFITKNHFEVVGLKSFTLYEFNVVTTTRFSSSKPVKCQEYTEPCTVPQLIRLEAISSETATISWRAPRKNNGVENYTLMFAQEPAPPFHYWNRYDVGRRKKFTLTELNPDTRYIACVLAQHNFGLAAMSKSLRFKTRSWWYNDDESYACDELDDNSATAQLAGSSLAATPTPFQDTKGKQMSDERPFFSTVNKWERRKMRWASTGRRRSTKELTLFLAPPSCWKSSRRASNRNNNCDDGAVTTGDDQQAAETSYGSKSSITSLDYQIT